MTVRRNVPRPKLSFDGTTLSGTEFTPNLITALNTASEVIVVDCSNFNGSVGVTKLIQSAALDLAGITARYNEYRYTNLQLHWIPHVAPGVQDAGSPMYVGYLDNPEYMATTFSTAAPADVANVKGIRNMKTFNAWQGWTYNVPLTRRLPWFNVNSNISTFVVETAARCIQGFVIVGAESITAGIDLGAFHLTYDVELRGLQTVLTS